MSNMTRRIFAALIPAAPIAARSGLGSLAQNIAKEPTPDWTLRAGTAVGQQLTKLVYPDNWKKYEEAQNAVTAYRAYRYEYERRAGGRDLDQNIMALKSVSKQHKIHMMIKKSQEDQEKDRSAIDKLIDLFGVRKFIDERHKHYMGNEPPSQAQAGML